MDLNDIRKEIDSVDAQLVDLYKKRMQLSAEVAEYKKNNNIESLDINESVNEELLTVEKDTWLKEVEGIKEFYAQFGDRLPSELIEKLNELEANLNK